MTQSCPSEMVCRTIVYIVVFRRRNDNVKLGSEAQSLHTDSRRHPNDKNGPDRSRSAQRLCTPGLWLDINDQLRPGLTRASRSTNDNAFSYHPFAPVE
jgi:hypothetical protein